jgi:hypothetical protein
MKTFSGNTGATNRGKAEIITLAGRNQAAGAVAGLTLT